MLKNIDELLDSELIFTDDCAEGLTMKLCNDLVNSYPYNYKAYNVRAAFYNSAGEYDLAVKDLFKASSINGKDWAVKFNLGCVLSSLEMYEGAINYFKQALSLNPESNFADKGRIISAEFTANHMIGACLIYLGKYSESLKYLDCAVKLNPLIYETYGSRAMARLELGDEKGSNEDLEEYNKLALLADCSNSDIFNLIK